MNLLYKCLVIIFCLINSACTPSKSEIALDNYQKALDEKNLLQVISTLKVLTNLIPDKYQTELNRLNKASENLNDAQTHLKNSNFYLAYINAHDSFYNFPDAQSKDILLTSGKVMLKILRVESALKQSFKAIPSPLKETVLSYKKSKISDWDLVKTNKHLENINKSLQGLTKALAIIEHEKIGDYSDEFSEWEFNLKQQKDYLLLLKNHLINTALSLSSVELKQLNEELIANTEDLLSLVRESMAIDALQPIFFKANQQYQPYLIINENISLAASLGKRNQHSSWYNAWSQLEKDTLTIPSPLSAYIKNINKRVIKLNEYIAKEEHSLVALETSTFNHSKAPPFIVQSLIAKVKKDKTMLLYGKVQKQN